MDCLIPIILIITFFIARKICVLYYINRKKRYYKETEAMNQSFVEAHSTKHETEKFKCPHCKSRENSVFAVDGDMGGPTWNTYKCKCGRIFDEPDNGNTGLSRA